MTDYILHVGGNQFYKNRMGVIEIYDQWRKISEKKIPLLLIGEAPELSLKSRYQESPYPKQYTFLV